MIKLNHCDLLQIRTSIHLKIFNLEKGAICFVLLLISYIPFAQVATVDSTFYTTVINNTYQLYIHQIEAGSHLYNGAEYIGTYPGTSGNPFFESDSFQRGTVSYDNILYKEVLLKYDLVKNELVIKGYQGFDVQLSKEKVDSFILMNHVFMRIEQDSSAGSGLPADFYDILYNGSTKVYAKRQKAIVRSFNPADPSRFREYNHYYIKIKEHYYKVDNKKDMINLFKDKSSDIRSFWRLKKFNFKKEPEEVMVQTAAYYDQLNK